MSTTGSSGGSATASADPGGETDLQRLTISAAGADADAVRAAVLDLAPAGWLETAGPAGAVRFAVWAPAGDTEAAGRVAAEIAGRGLRATVEQAPEPPEWLDGLRAHHRPVVIDRLRIRPPWDAPLDGLIDVVIDPGMAFGTGQHATTCGCLALLGDISAGSLLDVGCGSGILAIAARKLGHDPVWAIDTDPLAVSATLGNAWENGVGLRVALRDAGRDRLPATDTVVANITEIHVAALAGALPDPPPRHAVLSGFWTADAGGVADAWARRGYREERRIDDGPWTALRMVLA